MEKLINLFINQKLLTILNFLIYFYSNEEKELFLIFIIHEGQKEVLVIN